jgi:hypothetical protein
MTFRDCHSVTLRTRPVSWSKGILRVGKPWGKVTSFKRIPGLKRLSDTPIYGSLYCSLLFTCLGPVLGQYFSP